MIALEQTQLEKVKADFSIDEYLQVRQITLEGLDRISKAIRPGMWENDAIVLANDILKEMGAEKFWHRTYVRFGANTLKGYSDPAGPNVQLGENDIFFLDIGPVFRGYEGDLGATYVTGTDPEMIRCRDDSKKVFDRVHSYWKETRAAGIQLYQYASQVAEDLGWTLNLQVDGHRLGDFPHQLYSKEKLSRVGFSPSPYLWVVEIQIRHKTRDFGAFYEDIIF